MADAGQCMFLCQMDTSLMVFHQDEDHVLVNGIPHPKHGQVNHGNPNAKHDWQHELHGAAQHVHIDAGLNAVQMEDIQMELQQPQDDVPLGNG
jgi:hypothetical protein